MNTNPVTTVIAADSTMSGIANEPALGKTAWGTAEMKAALTQIVTEPGSKPADPATKPHLEDTKEGETTVPANGWIERTPYEYDQFTKDADHEWDSNAKIYEWDGDTGDVGPKYPELEIELFGHPESRVSHGIDFSK